MAIDLQLSCVAQCFFQMPLLLDLKEFFNKNFGGRINI